MSAAAIASAMDISIHNGEVTNWRIDVGVPTMVAIALIWLPTALRLITMAGGSVKAAGVEATSTGLLASSDEVIELLATVRTQTEKLADAEGGSSPEVHTVEADLDRFAERYLPSDESFNDASLSRLAREYESIRRSQPLSDLRTQAMNRLVNEAKIRALAASGGAVDKAASLLASHRDGDRIVGLAICEAIPDVSMLEGVLSIFSSSRSAFEMYHSLRALDNMLFQLDGPRRARVREVLEREILDPRQLGIQNDPYLPGWIQKVLSDLNLEA